MLKMSEDEIRQRIRFFRHEILFSASLGTLWGISLIDNFFSLFLKIKYKIGYTSYMTPFSEETYLYYMPEQKCTLNELGGQDRT